MSGHSSRAGRSLSLGSNMISNSVRGRQALGFCDVARRLAFLNRAIDLLGNRGTSAAARSAALHHDHDYITGALVGSERYKPSYFIDQHPATLHFGRPGFATNLHARNGGAPAGALVLDVAAHGVADEREVGRFHAQFTAQAVRELTGGVFVARRLLRFDALDDARIEHLATICHSRGHYRHLQGGYRNRAL